MKHIISGILAFLVLMACSPVQQRDTLKNDEYPVYDTLKAREYGADDYGMRKYVIAFLKKGPNRDLSQEAAIELQKAHMKNIGRMAEAGQLVLAGPFYGNGDLRGLYIFKVDSLEEARRLTQTDPAVQAGSLEMEILEWYGSAALLDVNKIHSTLAKIDFSES
jgi:uncharacterized protein YciI